MDYNLKTKLKATIEAMLFVATQPVPLQKIAKKVRQVAKKEKQKEIELAESAETSIPEENVADLKLVSSEPEFGEGSPKDGSEEPGSDNQEEEGEEKNSDTEEYSEDDEITVNDIKEQLMQKQMEFEDEITNSDVRTILTEIQEELNRSEHGIELVTVAKGYQFRTKYEISLYLKDEKMQIPSRFSPSALEALAIVAYQQPITRQKIEDIRGVDSGGVIKTLIDKGIVRLIGRSDEPGRSLVYGTSGKFLEIFGLNNLKDLPNLNDYKSLKLSQEKDEIEDQDQEQAKKGIHIEDLMDDKVDTLSAEENAILGDLNESIKELRKVEKKIVREHLTEKEEELGADAQLGADTQLGEGAPDQTQTEQVVDNVIPINSSQPEEQTENPETK